MSEFIPRTSRYNCGFISGDIAGLDWYKYAYPYRTFNVPLPNCTTYAYGRTMELNTVINNNGSWTTIENNYNPYWWNSTGSHYDNAETWYDSPLNTWEKGSEARLGAIACFSGDISSYGGHVAIVEQINEDGTVNLSESAYGGFMFNYWTNVRLIVGNVYSHVGERFQGYIYNPYIEDAPVPVRRNILGYLLSRKKKKGGMIINVTN